jgi:hypothetical protein
LGPDTYITSAAASPNAGVSEAQRLALSDANEYCANIGKKIMVVKSSDVIDVYGGGNSKVIFRCLAKEPGLQRPGGTKTLDVTFEDRLK